MVDFVWLDRGVNEPRMAHAGRVRLSLDLLASMLFPEGSRIIRAYESESVILGCGELELIVQHSALPEVLEGEVIPEVHPSFRTHYLEDGTCGLRMVEFDTWGILPRLEGKED